MTDPGNPLSLRAVLRDGARLIGRFIRARWGSFALAATGAGFFAAAIVASAIVVGNVTDDLVIPVLDRGGSTRGRLWPAVVAIVAVATWKALAITLRRTAAGWLQYRSQADVRQRLVAHQLKLGLDWYGRQSTGNLMSISDTDARGSTWILAPLPFGTGAVLLLFGTIGIISWLDWVLGLVTLAALATIVAIDMQGMWRTFEEFQEVQRRRGVVSSVAHESFDGALTVKALGREEFETGRMRAASEHLRDGIIEIGRIWGTYRTIVESLPAVTIVVLLVVGALRIRAGSLTAGELIGVAYLLSLLSIPVRLIGFVLWDMAESLASWRRVESVLSADDFVIHGNLQARPGNTGADVEGEKVAFSYEADEPVLHGLHLDIPAGRTVALVGATGSGKSTVAMLLARLWDPTSGNIRLDGRDLRDFARSALPGEVAFVPQEAFLFDDTVYGNITMGQHLSEDDVRAAARLAGADRFVSDLPDGYATQIGERGVSLSGGQRQRIALARALVRRPRLLILDDATSAVDPSVEAEILRGLRDAELPSTVIVVAYRRSSIVLADEVVFLEHGRIAAHGTHDQLLDSTPGYARLLRAYDEDAASRRAERETEVVSP